MHLKASLLLSHLHINLHLLLLQLHISLSLLLVRLNLSLSSCHQSLNLWRHLLLLWRRIRQGLILLWGNWLVELRTILKPCNLYHSTQSRTILSRRHIRISRAVLTNQLLLFGKNHRQHSHLLLSVTSTQTHIDSHIVLISPCARVKLYKLTTHTHQTRLVLVLAQKMQDTLEQRLNACLSKDSSNQFNLTCASLLHRSNSRCCDILEDRWV